MAPVCVLGIGPPVASQAPTLLYCTVHPPEQLLLPPPLSCFLLHSTAVTERPCVSVVGVHSLISYHGEVWQEGGTAGGPAVLYLTHRHLLLCLNSYTHLLTLTSSRDYTYTVGG